VSKKRTKTAQQPAKATTAAVSKKSGRRALKSVAKEVAGYRADLKVGGWVWRQVLFVSLCVLPAWIALKLK
jgi:hypothetical protein